MTRLLRGCRFAVFGLTLTLLLPASAVAQSCPAGAANPTIRCGMRAGPYFKVMSDIAHAQGCKFQCDNTNRCRAWTYVIATSACGLKEQDLQVRNDDCCFTGKKF